MLIKSKKKPLVVWAGDLQTGNKNALCPPNIQLDNGDGYIMTKTQRALWTAWTDAWENIKNRRRDVVTIFGGEILDIDAKGRHDEVITRNPESLKRIGVDIIAPALDITKTVIVLRGTEAHTGKSANLDEAMAADITGVDVIKNEETGTFSHWYLRQNIAGYNFDLAHHVSMGTRPWTEKNAANALAAQLIFNYAEWKEPMPDFALRGHVHRVSDSGLNFPIRAITCPCWTFADVFIHRIGAGDRQPQIGLMVIDLETREPEWIRYENRRETPRRIF